MVAECPGYSAVRQRHSALFGCLGGLDGLLTRVVTSEQFRAFMLQEQWQLAEFLHKCSQVRWQQPPGFLVAPVEGAALDVGVVSEQSDEKVEEALGMA